MFESSNKDINNSLSNSFHLFFIFNIRPAVKTETALLLPNQQWKVGRTLPTATRRSEALGLHRARLSVPTVCCVAIGLQGAAC